MFAVALPLLALCSNVSPTLRFQEGDGRLADTCKESGGRCCGCLHLPCTEISWDESREREMKYRAAILGGLRAMAVLLALVTLARATITLQPRAVGPVRIVL